MNIGERLRTFRRLHDLTQTDLEKLSGVPQATISRIENGHDDVSIVALVRLADVLRLDLDELVGREDWIQEIIPIEIRAIVSDLEKTPTEGRKAAIAAFRAVLQSFGNVNETCGVPA